MLTHTVLLFGLTCYAKFSDIFYKIFWAYLVTYGCFNLAFYIAYTFFDRDFSYIFWLVPVELVFGFFIISTSKLVLDGMWVYAHLSINDFVIASLMVYTSLISFPTLFFLSKYVFNKS